jgi:hypothetical protein
MLTAPGLALAWAISSATVFAGTDGCATSTRGKSISPATGAMSRTRLNGSASENATFTADEAAMNRSV